MNWEYEGKFLENFDKRWRGTIGDQICRIIRTGETDTDYILKALREKCDANVEQGYNTEFYQQLCIESYSFEARCFVEFLLWRENLSWDEKQRLKAEWQEREKTNRLKQIPPTEKQLNYLKKLGVSETPKTMHEASEMIGKAIRR